MVSKEQANFDMLELSSTRQVHWLKQEVQLSPTNRLMQASIAQFFHHIPQSQFARVWLPATFEKHIK